MNLLKSALGDLLQFDMQLIDFLEKLLSKNSGDRQQAIKQLKDYLKSPTAASPVGSLLATFGADSKKIDAALTKHHLLVVLVLGDVSELPDEGIEFPLAASGKAGKNTWGVEVAGELTGSLVPDSDGTLLEGALQFDAARDLYLEWSVGGKLSGSANAAGAVSAIGAKGAFDGSGEVRVSNFFLHDPGAAATSACRDDIRHFVLPGAVHSAGDLLGVVKRGDRALPRQLVRVRAEGQVAVGGSLNAATSFLGSFTVSSNALELDRVIPVQAGIGAELSFAYALSGTFDLLLQPSVDRPSMLRVALAKSQESDFQTAFKLKAFVECRGLDAVAKALLDKFVPQLDALMASLDSEQQSFPEIKELFTSTAKHQIESLLKNQATTTAIETWLKQKVDKDVDLKAKLTELLSAAAVKNADTVLTKISASVGKARDAVKDLVRAYAKAHAKLDEAVQKLAKAKLEVAFERRRHRLAKESVLFQVDLDPATASDLYDLALRGDFTSLLLASRQRSDVVLHSGELFESGKAEISTDFSFNALGFGRSTGSILTQEWDYHVSASGELTLGIKGGYESYWKKWGEFHSLAMLIDTRVLGILGQSGAIENAQLGTDATLTMHDEVKAKTEQIQKLESRLRSVGVSIQPGTLVSALALPMGSSSGGTVDSEAVLSLTAAALQEITNAPPERVRRRIAEALLQAYDPEPPIGERDDAGLPIFLWPEVRPWLGARSANTLVTDKGARVQSGSNSVRLSKEWMERVLFFAVITDLFAHFVSTLANLRNESLASGTPKAVEARILQTHKEAIQQLAQVTNYLGGGRDKLNRSVFIAIRDLASFMRPVRPVAAIKSPDGRTVVIGDTP